MAFTKLTDADVGVGISALGDNPNTDDNLSADQLKAKFDYDGAAIKTYINNTLTTELDAALGTGAITAAQLAGSIPGSKLSNSTITAAKLTGILPANVGIKHGNKNPPTTSDIADGEIYLYHT